MQASEKSARLWNTAENVCLCVIWIHILFVASGVVQFSKGTTTCSPDLELHVVELHARPDLL